MAEDSLRSIIEIVVIILAIWALYKFFLFLLRKQHKYYLPNRIKVKADWKYSKLLNKFKKRYHREPNKNEKFRIGINASHITIRRRGKKGHLGRQKIRKYLLEKNKVVEKYNMR